MALHEVQLKGYSVKPGNLSLGTFDSYGIEQLHVTLDDTWSGLAVTATFNPPKGEPVEIRVPENGLIDVPAEATANEGTGAIVYCGVANGVQLITKTQGYNVITHGNVGGTEPFNPSESLATQVLQAALNAEKNSAEAKDVADGLRNDADSGKFNGKDGAKGDKGETGTTPQLKIGEDNLWHVSYDNGATWVSLGVKATGAAGKDGEDGLTPHISENGNWWVGNTDTGVSAKGDKGDTGAKGADGVSPTASVTQTDDGAKFTVTDASGTTTAMIKNGTDGNDGAPGKDAVVDATLTQDGQAADAKVTGEKISHLEEDTTALQKRQNVLVGSETGNPASCDDAFAAPLCGLNVYGKSTQDGTPSPDTPVPIVSAGDSGSVAVKVTGKNLLHLNDGSKTFRGVTVTAKDGLISLSGTATESGYAVIEIEPFIIAGVVILSSSITSPSATLVSQTWAAILFQGKAAKMSKVVTRLVFTVTQGQTYNLTGVKVQVELGKTATAYSPYREQLLTLQTPNGLPGIPVTSGGNYTDPQGQQWVCDEVDLERGVKVQRVGEAKILSARVSNDPKWYDANKSYSYEVLQFTLPFAKNYSINIVGTDMCNRFIMKNFSQFYDKGIETGGLANESYAVFNISKALGICTTKEEFKTWFNENVVLYKILATPIETPLTPAEIAAYKALTAYAPDTVVQASDGAGVKMEYQRDVNIVIKKFEDAIASMTTT